MGESLTINNQDESEVYIIRKEKLNNLRQQGFTFPNNFQPKNLAEDIINNYKKLSKEQLEQENISVKIAGRIVLRRIMGKASFFHIQDTSNRIQVYIKQNDLPEIYDDFKHWDLGDIVGLEGTLFKTKTDELTVLASTIVLLTKSLRPLPDKFHGLADQELKYRKRYVDLIANADAKQTFILRSKIIQEIRNFMNRHDFLEVETPMMHGIPGGAVARPFVTYHNALDKEMYLRIAPELYLKRLVVGGFDRVYEINRNFRNEGLSTRHNPEFTMIEFYQAYATYEDLILFTENLLQYLCDKITNNRIINYQNDNLDFSKPFAKMSVKQAILTYLKNINSVELENIAACRKILDSNNIAYAQSDSLGKLQLAIFESLVEDKLIQPTFITEYPIDVSPLSRKNDTNQEIADRFELFIAGREIANGFSELNDPEDQAERFHNQMKEKNAGDLEAMHFDYNYIEALEYGMPPTAGEGIGIDRLVMLFTNRYSIRDVILFPQLK